MLWHVHMWPKKISNGKENKTIDENVVKPYLHNKLKQSNM